MSNSTVVPSDIWTAFGAVLVINNLFNWDNPERQTSTLARRHKLFTCLVLAAYAWHFLIQEETQCECSS